MALKGSSLAEASPPCLADCSRRRRASGALLASSGPEIVRALLGLAVLLLGVSIYLVDRQPSQTYFVSFLPSAFQVDGVRIWGPLADQIPTFAHVYAFILFSSVFLSRRWIGPVGLCLVWVFIDAAFEVGQHPMVAPLIAGVFPNWFNGVPLLESMSEYFLRGTFDPADLLSIGIGSIAAFATIRLTEMPNASTVCITTSVPRFCLVPLMVGLGAAGWLTTTASGSCKVTEAIPGISTKDCTGIEFTPTEVNPGPIAAVAERFPVAAVDGKGRALIVSRGRVNEDPQEPVHVFASTYDFATGALSPATDLVAVGGGVQTLVALSHAVAMDESGNGTTVWSAFNGGLYANHYDQSAGWAPRDLLSEAVIGDYRVAMDGFGRALAIWTEGEDLLARDYPSISGAWNDLRLVRNGPALALGDVAYQAFRGYAVWREIPQSLGGLGLLYASRFTGNQGWESPQNFWTSSDTAALPSTPRMAWHRQAPSESPVTIWRDSGRLFSGYLVPGTGWDVPQQDGLPGSDGGLRPRLAMAADLETVAVWEANGDIMASRGLNGAFGSPEVISSGSLPTGSPRVATDAAGDAVAVWAAGATVWFNRFAQGSGWEGAQQIASDLVAGGQPEVAMDNSGRTIVVWEGIDPGDQSKTRNVRYVFAGFDLPSDPISLDLASTPGSEASVFLTVTRTGTSGPIDFAFTGCPANVTCVASPNPIPSGQSSTTVSFTANATPPAGGDYDVTIEATSGDLTRAKVVTLHIQGGL